ncbi:MAG: CAP domain-containing protein [Tepidisphaerales bacterium]
MRFFESLEARALLTAAAPTALEVYFVQLVNRARANPAAEAKRYGLSSVNEGPPSTPLTNAPKQPLAINAFLVSAARKQATWQLTPPKGHNTSGNLDHFDGGTSTPTSRALAEGYTGTAGWENLAWNSMSGTAPTQAAVDLSHQFLFKDFNGQFSVAGRGHRVNILNDGLKEVGIGIAVGPFKNGSNTLNVQASAEDFGLPATGSFICGVAYADTVKVDNFYTPGEGLGSITITATRVSDNAKFTTKTGAAGSYAIQLDDGVYNVTASGKGLGAAQTYYNVVVSGRNVERDFVKPGSKDTTPPSASAQTADITTAGGTTATFTATFNDTGLIKAATVGAGDIQVVGPNGFLQTATFVSKNPTLDAVSIVATYRITAPGGTWDAADDGVYSIKLLAKKVTDKAGNAAAAGTLGTFNVSIT